MKVFCIGDTHWGSGLNMGKTDPETQINTRLLDFSATFNSIIDTAVENGAEAVVLTGDIFETRQPTSVQINECVKCLKRALDKGLKVFIAAGNHDQQRGVDATTIDFLGYMGLDNLKIATKPAAFTLEKVNLVLLPYCDRKALSVESNQDAVNIIKNKLAGLRKEGCYNILVGHLMMENTQEEDNPEGYSISEIVLPTSTFEGFDAVVMGHVHRSNVLSKKPIIIYSGSMERVSIGEKSHKKVSVLIDTKKNKFQLFDTKVRNMFDMDINLSDNPKEYSQGINDALIENINEFAKTNDLKESIFRLNLRIKESDAAHLNQAKIKEHLLSLGVSCVYSIQTFSFKSKQVRDSKINETTDRKKAMMAFLDSMSESDGIKTRLKKEAGKIIDGGN